MAENKIVLYKYAMSNTPQNDFIDIEIWFNDVYLFRINLLFKSSRYSGSWYIQYLQDLTKLTLLEQYIYKKEIIAALNQTIIKRYENI